MFNNQIIAGSSGQAGGFYPYSIDQSLRFNAADSAYLSRTPSSTSNQKTWTFNTWIKLGNMPVASGSFATGSIFSAGGGVFNKRVDVQFYVNDGFYIIIDQRLDGGTYYILESTDSFRDMSGWYMFTIIVDTTESTAADRIRMYVNGTRLTNLSNTNGYPAQNSNLYVNTTGLAHYIGETHHNTSDYRLDAYLAEVNFIDGTALDPTSFGEEVNGVFVPKRYSGSYGTNGFYLSFADSSAIGDDLSGNTNDFTANSLATSDVVPDSPTNNFATINNIYRGSNTNTAAYGLTSEGNLKFSYSSNSDAGTLCTHPFASGKYYWELRIVAGGGSSAYQHGTGIANIGAGYRKITNLMDGRDPNEIGMQSYTGQIRQGSTTVVNTLSTTNMPNGAIIGCAVDADNGAIYWSYNGTFMNSSDPTSGASKTNAHATWTPADEDMWVPTIAAGGGSVPVNVINFGQDSTFAGNETAGGNSDANGYGDFAYAPPSGFLALCSANLPEPTIGPNSTEQADDYFNTVLYTGTGASNSITGVNFQSDFTWIKSRSSAYNNVLWDTVRGATKQLSSNTTGAESTQAQGLTSFDSDGFTLGTNSNLNNSGTTYVGWNWKAGGTAVSNTDGSITSQVSAAPDAGFSICTYTGTATVSESFGHGLNQAPELVITKARNTTNDWRVHGSVLGTDKFLSLSGTGSVGTDSTNGGFPDNTDTVVNLGYESTNGTNYVAYCFHSVPGYQAVGTYVGNGSADGTFVYTGFRPAFVMVKGSSFASNWFIQDSKRDGINVISGKALRPNLNNAEDGTSNYNMDFLSNGFKLRTSAADSNTSGQTFIYLAFAEAPAKYSNAR